MSVRRIESSAGSAQVRLSATGLSTRHTRLLTSPAPWRRPAVSPHAPTRILGICILCSSLAHPRQPSFEFSQHSLVADALIHVRLNDSLCVFYGPALAVIIKRKPVARAAAQCVLENLLPPMDFTKIELFHVPRMKRCSDDTCLEGWWKALSCSVAAVTNHPTGRQDNLHGWIWLKQLLKQR